MHEPSEHILSEGEKRFAHALEREVEQECNRMSGKAREIFLEFGALHFKR